MKQSRRSFLTQIGLLSTATLLASSDLLAAALAWIFAYNKVRRYNVLKTAGKG